jgi:hypothetical protein
MRSKVDCVADLGRPSMTPNTAVTSLDIVVSLHINGTQRLEER